MRGHDPKRMQERRFAEGRGLGEGPDFKPWIKVTDLASQGVSSRLALEKTGGRQHHLLSHVETNAFLASGWPHRVRDLREQYNLPLPDTLQISAELGLRHPTLPNSRDPAVITTDILLTIEETSRLIQAALACKHTNNLTRRAIEKLEIERTYWTRRQVRWGLVTEQDLPEGLIKNLRWILPAMKIDLGESDAKLPAIVAYLFERIRGSPGVALDALCLEGDRRFNQRTGTCLNVVRHALAQKWWCAPLLEWINPMRALNGLRRGPRFHFLLSHTHPESPLAP
jgi:hypothetical protein